MKNNENVLWINNLRSLIYDVEKSKDNDLKLEDVKVINDNLEEKILSCEQILDYEIINSLFIDLKEKILIEPKLQENHESVVINKTTCKISYLSPSFELMVSSSNTIKIDGEFKAEGNVEVSLELTNGKKPSSEVYAENDNDQKPAIKGKTSIKIKGSSISVEETKNNIVSEGQEIDIIEPSSFKVTNFLFKYNNKNDGFFVFQIPENFIIKYFLRNEQKNKNIFLTFKENQNLSEKYKDWLFLNQKLYFKLYFSWDCEEFLIKTKIQNFIE